jgi:predicted XRE-type DNA-binding protein
MTETEVVEITEGSTNVYADLGMPNAEEMLAKARLVVKIAEIIRSRGWTQQQAAKVIGISQPRLSKMLRGQFRGISEAKMLEGIVRLGRDVRIVVGPARAGNKDGVGHLDVVFA